MFLRDGSVLNNQVKVGILVFGVGFAEPDTKRAVLLELFRFGNIKFVVIALAPSLQQQQFLMCTSNGASQFRVRVSEIAACTLQLALGVSKSLAFLVYGSTLLVDNFGLLIEL